MHIIELTYMDNKMTSFHNHFVSCYFYFIFLMHLIIIYLTTFCRHWPK